MQTFVPNGEDFVLTAAILDWRRLGKQRVEGLQILRTLAGITKGWRNHPAVKMWEGYEDVLATYTVDMCHQWIIRGYRDTVLAQVYDLCPHLPPKHMLLTPNWLDDCDVIESHRSNLVRKYPEHYRRYWPDVPDNLPYKWPV